MPAAVSAALTYVMWQRYGRTGKLMPAGLVAYLRCAMNKSAVRRCFSELLLQQQLGAAAAAPMHGS